MSQQDKPRQEYQNARPPMPTSETLVRCFSECFVRIRC